MLLTQHPGKWSPSFKSQPVQVSVIKEYNIGEVYIHDITTERIELFTNIEEFSCSHEDFFRIVNQALVAENPKAVLAALRMKL